MLLQKIQSVNEDVLKTDTEYLTAVENSDIETAKRLVDEAAKKNGYAYRMFHETDADMQQIHLLSDSIKNRCAQGCVLGCVLLISNNSKL